MKIAHAMVIPVCVASLLMILGGCVTTKSPHLEQGNVAQDAAADNVQLAVAYMQEGNLQRAKEKIDRALQEDPLNPNAHSVMAMFYARINDPKKAESEYREAMRLAPNDPGQVLFYGVYLCDQHRVDEGITKMLQVARSPLYRTPEAAYTDMGVCLLTAHRDEEAESAFKRALGARPDYAEGVYQEAALELAHGRALEARNRVQAFITEYPATPELLLVGLRAARTLGDASSAAQFTKILRAIFPNSEQARSLSADPQSSPR
ncbi:MAG: type IV pilus biogenesis/stability protein PilW [Steroidobacteraceae bacterium]